MSRPYLIVETPRVGELGHRFIVPPSITDEREVARFAESASRRPVGRDYLSVNRQVEQRLAGGSIRQGTETLIFAGVNVRKLDKEFNTEKMKSSLETLWPRVEALIEGLDQGGEMARSTLAHAGELDDWKRGLDENEALQIPRMRKPIGKLKNVLPAPARGIMVAVILMAGVILIAAVILVPDFFEWWKQKHQNSAQVPESQIQATDKKQKKPQNPTLRAQLETLADRWEKIKYEDGTPVECKPDDVSISLQRAKSWKSRHHPLEVEKFLNSIGPDDPVSKLITRLNSDSPPKDSYFALINKPASDEFAKNPGYISYINKLNDLLGQGGYDEAIQLRKSLYEAWTEFKEVQETFRDISDKPESHENDRNRVFLETILFIHSMEENQLDSVSGFIEPKTPIFDQQDVLIIERIEQIFDAGKNVLSAAFTQSKADSVYGQNSLVDRLKELKNRIVDIRNALTLEEDLWNKLQPEGDTKMEITKCYGALRRFFTNLPSPPSQ